MVSKSWGLTIAMYALAASIIIGEVFFGLSISPENQGFIIQMITLTTGSTTAGGVFNSVMKNKALYKETLEALKAEIEQRIKSESKN